MAGARELLAGLVSAYMLNQLDERRTLPALMILTPLNMVRLRMQDVLGATATIREESVL